jgi:hypothetical protein
MILRIGMIGESPGWEEILRQEGVPFGAVTPAGTEPAGFSVMVACRALTPDEVSFLREYLRAGGALIGYAGFLSGLADSAASPVRVRYLEPGGSPELPGLSLMDVEFEGALPREANCLRTQDNVFAAFVGELHGGWGVVLPFDPGEAMEDFRAAERYFYARPDRLPSERVSRVAKGEVFHLVHAALERLHHARGFPYAHLARFPSGCTSVFALRIDTDGGTRDEVNRLASIAREFGLGFTWFVDAGSHEGWLRRFAELPGHEVGLHCYQHRIFLDGAKDAENVKRGVETMRMAGLPARSFAAPFGFWSPELGRTVDGAGFAYSSEFGWAYDAFPHRPVISGCRFSTLQVPVHPVSVGNLRRAGFSPARMKLYYTDIADRKIVRGESLFFYHHPSHHEWGVVRALCEIGISRQARPMTLGQYAGWWEGRSGIEPHFVVERDSVGIEPPHGPYPADVDVIVSRSGGETAQVGIGTKAQLRKLSWKHHEDFRPPPDIKRTREFDLRGSIGRQFTRLQRRFI